MEMAVCRAGTEVYGVRKDTGEKIASIHLKENQDVLAFAIYVFSQSGNFLFMLVIYSDY